MWRAEAFVNTIKRDYRGDVQSAVAFLASAETGFMAADEHVHAAVARDRRGELLAGPHGEALRQEADAWMAREHIVNPARICALISRGDGARPPPPCRRTIGGLNEDTDRPRR